MLYQKVLAAIQNVSNLDYLGIQCLKITQLRENSSFLSRKIFSIELKSYYEKFCELKFHEFFKSP